MGGRGLRTEHVVMLSRSHVPRGNAARTLQRPVHNAEAEPALNM